MKRIYKVSEASPIDCAAEELKKYLRMMDPDGGDVLIACGEGDGEGYRLGLMTELGLDVSDVKDPELDDVIYIKTDTRGGIIAGSNPRSVLIAVYEFLRRNGCRWLFPGVDGEYIPTKALEPVDYRHAADARYRGNCIEGAIEQRTLLEYIEFLPKVGLNTFMIQFRNPSTFYDRYYDHRVNGNIRRPESITKATSLAWTRAVECEMAKRHSLHDSAVIVHVGILGDLADNQRIKLAHASSSFLFASSRSTKSWNSGLHRWNCLVSIMCLNW